MNLLIVEDDPVQQNGLKHILTAQYPDIHIATASSYTEAVAVIDSSNIDLFMLDINLGHGMTGLDVCSYLRGKQEHKDTPVIFITDITNPNLDVINKYHCRYYFSKPYNREDVVSAIDTVLKETAPNPRKIQLKDIQGILFHVVPQDIIYVKAEGHHKHVFTVNGDFIVTNSSFDTIVEYNIPLVRCHKSYYINPKYTLSYDRVNNLLNLSNIANSIPIGRKYKNETEIYLENR